MTWGNETMTWGHVDLPPQVQETGQTAWQVFLKVPLWAFLFAFFGLSFVVPCVIALVYIIADLYADPSRSIKPADILIHVLPIVMFVTAIVMMRNWRLKTPQERKKLANGSKESQKQATFSLRNEIYVVAIIAALGYTIPYFASVIGSANCGFKPWFSRIGIEAHLFAAVPNSIAVGTAWLMYQASKRFGDKLKFLPVVCGYGGFAWFYLNFNISSGSTAGIAIIFFPIFSIFFFIAGYFLAMIIHYIVKKITTANE